MKKNWLIISWTLNDHLDGRYGRVIEEHEGTYEEACEIARQFTPIMSPVGVVEEVV